MEVAAVGALGALLVERHAQILALGFGGSCLTGCVFRVRPRARAVSLALRLAPALPVPVGSAWGMGTMGTVVWGVPVLGLGVGLGGGVQWYSG